jgi:predicted esterase
MKRRGTIIIFFFLLATFISDKQLDSIIKTFKELRYLLYLPEDYEQDTTTCWPVILFLHGSRERGNDLNKVKENGPPKLIELGKKYPFIVISPQIRFDEFWDPDRLVKLLKEIAGKYRVDGDRIYLTGLSMGGYGTWYTAIKYPELFAAIAPVCGGGDPRQTWKIRHTPVWIFHGAKDPVVPVSRSISMASSLLQYNNMMFTLYPDAKHDSWTETYNNEELYKWFLAHKKFRFSQSEIKGSLENYTGLFLSGKDAVTIFQADNKLWIRSGEVNSKVSLLTPGLGNTFFFDKNSLSEIKYNFDQNGKMASFIFYNEFPKAYFRVK